MFSSFVDLVSFDYEASRRKRDITRAIAGEIERIYEEAAPAISSAISGSALEFLHSLHKIVHEAVEGAGGRFE